MPHSEAIEHIRWQARMAYQPIDVCPIAAPYKTFISELHRQTEIHVKFVSANRKKYNKFFDFYRDLDPADAENISPGLTAVLQQIEDSTLCLIEERKRQYGVFLECAVAKMDIIGKELAKKPYSLGELAIEGFETFRLWRKDHLDQRDVDMIPLFDMRGIGSGQGHGTFDCLFSAWAKGVAPVFNLNFVRQEVMEFLAEKAPELASDYLRQMGARVQGFKSERETRSLVDVNKAEYQTFHGKIAYEAGWRHGGDFDGFWFDGNSFDSSKAAASADEGATYATAEEVCNAERLLLNKTIPSNVSGPVSEISFS